ncbi:MAG: hypothetical protein J5855_10510 [Mailhella sp.]|nr:hypothetical protein [Mailhella sp.]
MKNTTLLEIAHTFITRHAPQNGVCLDATAGNGHDTLFLCSLVHGGLVIAADIQDAALESTQRLLAHKLTRMASIPDPMQRFSEIFILSEHGKPYNVIGKINNTFLLKLDHADYGILPGCRFLDVCMFNLGYLPGSDKSVKTTACSTAVAVSEAYKRLRSGGVMTIHCYTGHEGGEEETEAVGIFFSEVAYDEAEITRCTQFNKESGKEHLFLIRKH